MADASAQIGLGPIRQLVDQSLGPTLNEAKVRDKVNWLANHST